MDLVSNFSHLSSRKLCLMALSLFNESVWITGLAGIWMVYWCCWEFGFKWVIFCLFFLSACFKLIRSVYFLLFEHIYLILLTGRFSPNFKKFKFQFGVDSCFCFFIFLPLHSIDFLFWHIYMLQCSTGWCSVPRGKLFDILIWVSWFFLCFEFANLLNH